MTPAHAQWIAAYVETRKGHVRGMCVGACREMRAAFPELIEVRGWANDAEHVWLTAPDGEIIDPTAAQFNPPIDYRPFQPGDMVRVGRCMNCGDPIFAAVERLDDPKYARSTCDDECARELEASLR